MNNYKKAIAGIKKHFKTRAANARAADWRLDARGQRVQMTPDGLKAELKKIEKEQAATIRYIEKVANAPKLAGVKINVEWHKNRTWGNCPRAEAWVIAADGCNEYGTGSASGCGYDKESAAIESALNASLILQRFLIENWKRCAGLYGCSTWRGFPELSISGKGIETLRTIFETVRGCKWEHAGCGKLFDCYNVTKKGAK